MRSADELVPVLEPEEPSSTLLVAALLERGVGRHVRAWVVEDGSEVLGALVVSRLCRDRWQAFPFLFQAGAAELLGATIDESPAYIVSGPGHLVDPLVPHVTRARGLVGMPLLGVRAGAEIATASTRHELAEDERIRLAVRSDLGALVELFNGYELDSIPTVRRIREYLTECFDVGRPIIVADLDGEIAGALRFDAGTRQFFYLGAQTVLPEHRGKGLSNLLMGQAMMMAAKRGVGGFVIRSDRNPVPLDDGRRDPDKPPRMGDPALWQEEFDVFTGTWYQLWLHPRRQLRGAGRARQIVERLEGPVRRRPPPDPYSR